MSVICHFVRIVYFEWDEVICFLETEAIVRRCSVTKVFLKIPQYLQENTCVGVSFLIKLLALNLAIKNWPVQRQKMQEQLVTGVNLNNRSYFANPVDFLHFPRKTVCPKQQKSSHPEKSLQKWHSQNLIHVKNWEKYLKYEMNSKN